MLTVFIKLHNVAVVAARQCNIYCKVKHVVTDVLAVCLDWLTRGQSNLTKSVSRGAHSPVRGHPRGSKVVPLNSWGRVSY